MRRMACKNHRDPTWSQRKIQSQVEWDLLCKWDEVRKGQISSREVRHSSGLVPTFHP